ncbi:hypothetical protein BDV12DRAFT_103316 [Aspergillus spectabilis]
MADIAALDDRYRALCTIDDSKHKLIADLFSQIHELERQLRKQKDELNDQTRVIDSFRRDNEKYETDLATICRDKNKLSYISVLIDGDGMNFQQGYVQNGKDGGHEAARALIQAVDDHVRKVNADVPPNTFFKIRVYANIDGLTKAYREANLLPADRNLAGFVHGFNQADDWCDFVDVGSGKECSDVKLKAIFKQDILDIHCRRVIFCASADNGYAHLLRQHEQSDRISLVEGPPFAFEIRQLADKYTTTAFQTVFMSTKLKPDVRSPVVTSKPLTPPATPSPNYASAARSMPLSPPIVSIVHPPANGAVKPVLSVCLNAKAQRVDQPLQVSTKDAVNALKKRKLCNQFHILGSCIYAKCSHKHGPQLSSRELIDLMYIARSSPCYNGLDCRYVKCISGHRCAFGKGCANNDWESCKFDETMHHGDTVIVETVEEYCIV